MLSSSAPRAAPAGARAKPLHRWAPRMAHPARSGASIVPRVAQKTEDAEVDAFAELVRMAVEKDPSLAKLAEEHLGKRGAAAASAAGPAPQLLPGQNKPPWLRQRAPQGDR